MGFFDKNKNETAYVGGKKHWVDVIKNSGAGGLLIWRQPEEDFNTNSTLIVMPGEQAIFVNGGVIEQVFDNGTYKLSTQNYPFISRLRNAFSGGVSTFNCVVYFVRIASSREILWGTDSPIQVRDPVLKISTSLRANGAYKLKVKDSSKFLLKLIGNNVKSATQTEMNRYFSRELQQSIKASIARHVINSDKEILEICASQDILAQALEPEINKMLEEYGIELLSFSIATISIPEDDPGRQKLENAFANKGVMNILGADWERQQQTEILHTIAKNESAGGAAALAGGLGVGMVAGGAFSGMSQQLVAQGNNAAASQQPATEDPVATLQKLKSMLDAGLIPQQAYETKMNEILSRM